MNETLFRALAATILCSGLAISIYFRRKADRETGETVSLKEEGLPMVLALRIGGLVMWLSMFTALIYPPALAWSRAGLPDWARWTGVSLGIVCLGLLAWMFRSLGASITPTVATRREHRLVTHGPYRWIRHPLYTFGTLFFLSIALVIDSWFIALMALLAITALTVRLPKEEALLEEKFGASYREYRARTGKYLPRLGRRA